MIAELVIGHTQQGLRNGYDLHRYEAVKRHALELWNRSAARDHRASTGQCGQLR